MLCAARWILRTAEGGVAVNFPYPVFPPNESCSPGGRNTKPRAESGQLAAAQIIVLADQSIPSPQPCDDFSRHSAALAS